MSSFPINLVTVNYGSSTLLRRNLAGIPADVRVTVVDNFSDAGERERVLAMSNRSGWTALTPASNIGFGEGVNSGVERAIADGAAVIVVINPDAVLTANDVLILAESARSHPLSLVAPVTTDLNGRNTFDGMAINIENGRTHRADVALARHPWLTGACLAFTPQAWRLAGGFAQDYFLYWEDVELSWTMLANGGGIHVEEGVRVVHDAGGTQEKSRASGKSPTYVYYNCRNRLVFAARNLGRDHALRWARSSPGYALEVMLRGGTRRVLLSPSHIWAAVKGSLSGLAYIRRFKPDGAQPEGLG